MIRFVVPDVTGELSLDLELDCGDVVATNRYAGVVFRGRPAGVTRGSA